MIKILIVFLSLALFSQKIKANTDTEVFFKEGVGIGDTNSKFGDVKLFSVGYQKPFKEYFIYQLEAGIIADASNGQMGHGSCGFGDFSVGMEVAPTHSLFYASVMLGVALITSTNDYLSSFYELNHEINIGVHDEKNRAILFEFKHMSNGDLVPPNYGRNFILFKVQLPLFF